MLAPHEPTWLEWAESGRRRRPLVRRPRPGPRRPRPPLRPAPTPDPPEEGPGSTMTRSEAARLGGRARARALCPAPPRGDRRPRIRRTVQKRFGGDRRAAIEGLVAAGLAAQDRQLREALRSSALGRDRPPGRRPRPHAAPGHARGPPPGRGRRTPVRTTPSRSPTTPCVRPPLPPPPPAAPPRGGRRPRPLGTTRRPLRRRGGPLPPRAPRRPPLHHRTHRPPTLERRPRTGQLVLPGRARRPLGALLAHDHLA